MVSANKGKLTVENRNPGLVILYAWRKNGGLIHGSVMLVIAGAIILPMTNAYAHFIAEGFAFFKTGPEPWFFTAVTFLLAASIYAAIGYFVNSTKVSVGKDGVHVRNQGLPWPRLSPGGRATPVRDISDVRVAERRTRLRGGILSLPSFSVSLTVKGQDVRLYHGFYNDKPAAFALASGVRRALGLKP